MDEHPHLGKGHAVVLSLSIFLAVATLFTSLLWMGGDFLSFGFITAPLSVPSGLFGGLIGGYGAWSRYRRQHQRNTGIYLDKIRSGYLVFWVWVGILSGGPLGIFTLFVASWVGEYLTLWGPSELLILVLMVAFVLVPIVPGLIVLLTVIILDWGIRPRFKNHRIRYLSVAGGILFFFCISTLGFTLSTYNHEYAQLERAYAFVDENPSWFLLPKTPSDVNRLVAIRPFSIFVETIDGQLLGCNQPSKLDSNCWYQVDAFPDNPVYPCDFPYEVPAHLNSDMIVQTLQKEYCEYWFGGDYNISVFQYVLLKNGEIWQWGLDEINLTETPEFNKARFEMIKKTYRTGGIFGVSLTASVIILVILAQRVKQKLKIV